MAALVDQSSKNVDDITDETADIAAAVQQQTAQIADVNEAVNEILEE